MGFPEGWNRQWPGAGSTGNTDYFLAGERILVALPHEGAVDDVVTANENVEYQAKFFIERDERGVVIVVGDRLVDQSREARQVYTTKPTSDWAVGFALVSTSLLARAMFSFFMGLSSRGTKHPIKMFPTLDAALIWARQEVK